MKIFVRNGSGTFRVPVPRGLKVTAYSSGLFFDGPGSVESRFCFTPFVVRGFKVSSFLTCSGSGLLVSWDGGLVDGTANRWWIVCE